MRTFLNSILIVILVGLVSCSEKKEFEEVLFQENKADWFTGGEASWEFVDNELVGVAKGEGGFVMTKKSYSDFVLELEFKPDSTMNSGVFIRCKENSISNVDCYEINIWDLHPNQDNRTGAVVNRMKPLKKLETLNKWNTYKIKNDKDHLQVWINDVKTIDIKDEDLIDGPIALQAAESGKISFRNVRLTPLN